MSKRNPLDAMPAALALRQLSPDTRKHLARLLAELATDARRRADKAWATHKAPMACYWKAVAVYAGHTRRMLK